MFLEMCNAHCNRNHIQIRASLFLRHGIFQRGSQWADGPAMVTQCPVRPGGNYTYNFNVTGQEGTLWWHAHFSFLRATVYGALIILPRGGADAYPFAKPDKEEIVMLGEWWNANVFDLQQDAFLTGDPARPADAYTINGKPGDRYNCSATNRTYAAIIFIRLRLFEMVWSG